MRHGVSIWQRENFEAIAHRRIARWVVSTLLLNIWSLLVAHAEIKPWEVFEVALEANKTMPNPYVDSLPDHAPSAVRVIFEGTSGEALGNRCVLEAFWDGGKTFKARFAPPFPGEWSYRSESSDSAFPATTGTLTCGTWSDAEKAINPTRRGFVRVCQTGPRAGRYFEYTDGTPFLWIGDTWWNWTKRGIRFSSFQKLADDRANKGFNVGQLFFAGRGWGKESSLLDATFKIPDLDHIREVESMIRYANTKGITVWIHPWWGGANLEKQIGAENLRRWWRYVVARLAAHNVIWTLAGEYNQDNYGGLGLDFWKELGSLVVNWDPYDRLVSAHPTPPGWSGGKDAPQWSTGEVMHDQEWMNYNQSQVGHGRWRNEMIPKVVAADYARVPAKPIVVTEPWYEFVEGTPSAADIRFGALSAILSGAAGHSYAGGHIWKAHVPEAPAHNDTWPMEMEFTHNTLDYPGARSLAAIGRFLRTLPWWTFEPHPELVADYPAPFCSAVAGEEYIVFLRWNGSVRLDLRPSNATDEFEQIWINLATFTPGQPKVVHGGDWREFSCPSGYPADSKDSDWLLHVKKRPAK